MRRAGPESTFWALSDPTRLELLDRIARDEEATITDLAEDLPITRQAVTRHLRTLEAASLVTARRRGRERCYRIRTAPLTEAREWLERRAARWDAALSRLAAHLDDADDGS